MNLPIRAVFFLLLTGAVWSADVWLNETVLPRRGAAQSIAALNGGEMETASMRSTEHLKDAVTVSAALLTVGLLALCFGTYRGRPTITYNTPARKGADLL